MDWVRNPPYPLVIQWSEKDNAILVRLPEFEGYQTHGETYEDAARRGQETIESLIEAYQAEGRALPEPAPAIA